MAAYLPAVLLQIDLLSERITYGRFVFAVVLWAWILFGGHPETASHIFFLALLMLIWIVVVERPFGPRQSIRFVVVLGSAMFVAALVAAPFLAPFAEAVTKSQRYQQLQVHPPAVGFTDLQSSVLLLQPHFFGQVPAEILCSSTRHPLRCWATPVGSRCSSMPFAGAVFERASSSSSSSLRSSWGSSSTGPSWPDPSI